jgi:hypothetical protein
MIVSNGVFKSHLEVADAFLLVTAPLLLVAAPDKLLDS